MHKPFQYIPPKPPMWFNLFWPGIFGAILGFLTATGQKDLMLIYAILGLAIFTTLTYVCVKILKGSLYSSILCSSILFFSSLIYFGLTYSIVLALIKLYLFTKEFLSPLIVYGIPGNFTEPLS